MEYAYPRVDNVENDMVYDVILRMDGIVRGLHLCYFASFRIMIDIYKLIIMYLVLCAFLRMDQNIILLL